MKRTSNPSSILSKEQMAASLAALMNTYPYKDITISQITSEAGISRATFYRNFQTKDEVLSYSIYLISKDFFSYILKKEEIVLEDNLLFLLKHCKKHSDFFLRLRDNQLLYLLLKEWTRYLPLLHKKKDGKIKNFPKNLPEKQLRYLLTFNVGGFFNLILNWIENGMTDAPEEIIDAVKTIGMLSYSNAPAR